ncbi:MAG: gliding motility-associated C-terminal domain-containing protein [Elusimicrobia bacterium]|nr:gliding motility-associated C-terminal domain-containing protein [Elusimicrobiota bacterium]
MKRKKYNILNSGFKRLLVLTSLFSLLSSLCLYGTSLDTMDSAANWSSLADSGAEISVSSVTGYIDNAVRMTYDLTSGNYVLMGKSFHSMDQSAADSISFWYKGTGDSNNIQLKAYDADGDIYSTTLTGVTDASIWTQAIVTFSGMSLWVDDDGQPYGNGSLDKSNIKRLGIAITRLPDSNLGTVIIDKMQGYMSSTVSNKSIDQCGETGTTNALGKTVSTGQSGSATISFSVETANPSPSGGPYYKIDYNIPSGEYALIEENLFDTANSSMNASNLSYITFYLKGESGGEKPLIELWDGIDDPDALDAVNVWDTAVVTTEWQLYAIPLDNFDSESLYKSSLSALKFVFKEGASTVYLDQLRFSSSAIPDSTVGPVSTIDDMDQAFTSFSDWGTPYAERDTVLELSTVSGYDGNATQFSYQFNTGWWAITERGLGYNVTEDKGFRFKYKGTGGSNNIEFKVTDVDNVVYIKKFYNATNTDGVWRTISFPYTDLTIFSSGSNSDTSLDFKNIKTIDFAVSKNAGGAGTFTVDDLETISDADFQQVDGFNGIISQFSIRDNPFSPNNDGEKDNAVFNYTLNTYAQVKLTIYDTAGNPVVKIDEGEKSVGSHTITWNGCDSGGRLLRNGLYFYNFKAENSNNQQDSVKHIIAIIR